MERAYEVPIIVLNFPYRNFDGWENTLYVIIASNKVDAAIKIRDNPDFGTKFRPIIPIRIMESNADKSDNQMPSGRIIPPCQSHDFGDQVYKS